MKDFKIFESDRIFLKKIDIHELTDEVMSWFKDDSLMEYYTTSKKEITREELINSIKMGEESERMYTFGVYMRDDWRLIGTVKIGPIIKAHGLSDLVILIGNKDYHGKGLAVEAIKLGNKVAFEEFNIRKLSGGMYEDNDASYKAYTRAGWHYEGILKDHYMHNGIPQNRILISCFNPKYLEKYEN